MWKEGAIVLKKRLTLGLSAFLMVFYIGIIIYVLLAVLNIDLLANLEVAMVFEVIGFLLLAYFIWRFIISRNIKTGFFVPLIMVTVVYTIILDAVNIAYVTATTPVFLGLINVILLFLYCLISIPMYIMGNR